MGRRIRFLILGMITLALTLAAHAQPRGPRNFVNQLRASGLLSAVLLLCGAANTANADEIPGFGFAPYYYYSTDMRPVEVSFARVHYRDSAKAYEIGRTDPATRKFIKSAPIAIATLPRAYIARLSDYTTDDSSYHHPDFVQAVLPDRIVGNDLQLLLTYPEGLPYSVVYETWPKHRPDLKGDASTINLDDFQGMRLQIRALLTWAYISANSSGRSRESRLFDSERQKVALDYKGDYQGFQKYKLRNGGSNEKYFDNGADEIRLIVCAGQGKKPNPDLFCEYFFPLNPHLTARLKFLDFRLYGGRAFARERIRAFKKAMCPILKCDERALRAADKEG